MPKNEKISKSVIRRLPRYYRYLGELMADGMSKISSRELAERMGLTASQIRQDLNCFGGFGQQGYGYNIEELRNEIAGILGIGKEKKVILVGAGNLGRVLALNMELDKYSCILCGIFDSAENLIGTELAGNIIMSSDEMEKFCKENNPEIAILCVPKSAADKVCSTLIGAGVKAFWNFSHYDINIEHGDISVENVHLGDSILALCYSVSNN